MAWTNSVVWTEGMFLRTQHFQQSDRRNESLTANALRNAIPFGWGFEELEISEALLLEGKVGLDRARGAFRDGGFFDAPAADDAPTPFLAPGVLRDSVIYLCAPVRRAGSVEFAIDAADPTKRYHSFEVQTPDVAEEGAAYAPLTLGKLNLSLKSDKEDIAGFDAVAVCRIIEKKADGALVLDKNFIPTVMSSAASARLTAVLSEVRGLLVQRGEAISSRLGGAQKGGVAEVTDFMLLQTVNRAEAIFRHLASVARIHPERLYTEIIALAGELSTYAEALNRTPEFPPYRHDDLTATFERPLRAIQVSLARVFEQTAISIPLELRGFGIRVGMIPDRSLFDDCVFVLAAKAATDPENLRSLGRRTTIGSVNRIRDLVNTQKGGAPIKALASEPRQIPYRAGFVYFSVGDGHEEWLEVKSGGSVAIHVSGDIPELELALWAVRGRK